MEQDVPSDAREHASIDTLADTARVSSSVRPRDVVGRYTILERVGAGAMGVVYLANDPELERRVAIKLLHRDAHRPETSARRLRREARAMARLQHPNIVAVHDVGTHDGHVFVAMEFVRGTDLRSWVADPRPWREVITTMLQAARGLIAAHESGVIHRDFKPDNVLIGGSPSGVGVEATQTSAEIRARVTDFGVAAIGTDLPVDANPGTGPIELGGGVDELTKTGGLVGTPAYLAPEQLAGGPADELTDQFAFCVSTWELLFGERPFAGTSLADLAMAVISGEIRTPPSNRRVPAALRRALARGLGADRTRRWPSMRALADALERVLGRRRTLVGIAAVGLAVVGSAALAAWLARDRAAPCEPQRELERVWNEGARADVHGAIGAFSPAALADLGPRVDARIDGWAEQWVGAGQQVCVGPNGWSDALRDRANLCLTRRLDELSATLAAIVDVRLTRPSQVLDLVDGLPAIAPCKAAELLLAEVAAPSDATTIAGIAELRAAASRLRARRRAGETGAVLPEAEALVTRARQIGYAPLVAEMLLEQGEALGAAGSYGPDAIALEEAFYAATAAGDSQVAMHAAMELVDAIGGHLARPRDATAWIRHARALADALPDDPLVDAQIDTSVATLHQQLAELDLAEPLLLHALAAYETAGAERDVALTHAELGQLALRRGDLDAATGQLELARDLTLAALGPHHPDSALPLVGLGTIAMRRGEPALAAAAMEQALAIFEAALGPDHPNVAGCLHNLGSIEVSRDRLPEARALLQRALAQRERTLGPDHPDVGATLGLLGSVDEDLGELALARSRYERALAIFVASYGEEHPRVADVLNNLGTVAIDEHDTKAAIAALERALAIRRKVQGEDHPDYAMTLGNLAKALRAQGDRPRALALAEQALRIDRERLGADHPSTRDDEALVAELKAP